MTGAADAMELSLAEAAVLAGPSVRVVGDPARTFARVHTDTRTLRTGDLFVALKGERFDAHDFLPQARAAGAAAALAAHGIGEAGLDGLLADDPLAALQSLAAGWRARFRIPVVAVAGSNGKTTVTQMVAAILRAAHGEAAHATSGNLNNHIGVPLTVLGLRPFHRAAVVELGMNHVGEIEALARIARPTVALVNNAQREHQEFMAGVEAVARENGAVFLGLPAEGCAIFPAGDPHDALWSAQAGARRVLRFALADDEAAGPAGADVVARARWADGAWRTRIDTPAGRVQAAVRVAGRHNVLNAAAAAACGVAAGVAPEAVARGLGQFVAVKGRSQVKALSRGGRDRVLVDDTYNANPDSVRAAIDVLAGLPAPRWLVLGDMGEVGEEGPRFHAEIGAFAAERGIDHFWCAGRACADAARAYGARARHFDDTPALVAALEPAAEPPFESVLVKGSRFMGMERVVARLAAGGAHAA